MTVNVEPNTNLERCLRIGLIQTEVDNAAWENPLTLNMKGPYEEKVRHEIKKGFRSIKNCIDQPSIIILPEVTVPLGYTRELEELAKSCSAVTIAGLDFDEFVPGKVRNRAVIIVPQGWPDQCRRGGRIAKYFFGKTHFSNEEKSLFSGVTPRRDYHSDPTMYIIDGGIYGIIGVAICSDFFDLERFIIYKGRIHHMLVIAHNKDTGSYYFLAEAISRLVYCNVIICNSGCYGDTLVFSPNKKPYKRIIYRHTGAGLFSTQVVSLPVMDLEYAQCKKDYQKLFKSTPPGYIKKPFITSSAHGIIL